MKLSAVRELMKIVQREVKKVFNDDEVQFRLVTSFKITLIPLFSLTVMILFIFIFLQMSLNAFNAFGLTRTGLSQDVFFDFALKSAWDLAPFIFILLIFQALLGIYISTLFLRPFKAIGSYCLHVVEGKDAHYDPDFYTDLKLLTRFSEYFFNIAENALNHGHLNPIEIPKKFQRIHKPVFEKDFFIQYFIFIILSSIIYSLFTQQLMIGLFEDIMSFATQALPKGVATSVYLEGQMKVLESIFWVIVVFHIVLNLILAVHLYGRISGPAFGIFATMRSFLKGNTKARVHLIGHYYVRKQCRYLNKYLDYIERNCIN